MTTTAGAPNRADKPGSSKRSLNSRPAPVRCCSNGAAGTDADGSTTNNNIKITMQLNAVLVSLHIPIFPNSRQDDSITKEVKTLHSLKGEAGRWVKVKLPEHCLSPIRKCAAAARSTHYQLTLTWEDGSRLLPIAAKTRYEQEMAKAKTDFNALVDEFVAAYPSYIEAAREMHNGTFRESDYPPAGEVRQVFGFTTDYSPVPQSSHFDVHVIGPAVTAMRAQLEAANARKVEEAVADAWERLLGPVRKMAETLSQPDAVFRDSLIGNVDEVCGLIPSLSLGNAKMEAAAAEIRKTLSGLDPTVLRANRVVRRTAAQAADNIVRRLGAMGVRKFAE